MSNSDRWAIKSPEEILQGMRVLYDRLYAEQHAADGELIDELRLTRTEPPEARPSHVVGKQRAQWKQERYPRGRR